MWTSVSPTNMDRSPQNSFLGRHDYSLDFQEHVMTPSESPNRSELSIYAHQREQILDDTPNIEDMNTLSGLAHIGDPRISTGNPPLSPPLFDEHSDATFDTELSQTIVDYSDKQVPSLNYALTNGQDLSIKEDSLKTSHSPNLTNQPVPAAVSSSGLFKPPISQQSFPLSMLDVREPLVPNERVLSSNVDAILSMGVSRPAFLEQNSPVSVWSDVGPHIGRPRRPVLRQKSSTSVLDLIDPTAFAEQLSLPSSDAGPSCATKESAIIDEEFKRSPVDIEAYPIIIEPLPLPFSTAASSSRSIGTSVTSHKSSVLTQKAAHQVSRKEISFQNEWQKLKQLRIDVWSLRSIVHQLRGGLREKQMARSVTQNKFLQYIREHSYEVDHNPTNLFRVQNTMAKLLKDCEDAAEEYGPIEDECIKLENQLGRQEFKLQRLEEKLYKRPAESILESSNSEAVDSEQLSNSSSSSYEGSEIALQFHPLVAQYLSKVGDMEILRERLEWHVEEKDLLEEEKETRTRVELNLAEVNQEWLDDFSDAEAKLISEFEETEKEAERLRQACFSQGLIDEDGNVTDFQTLEQNHFLGDHLNDGRKSSEYSRFSRLIPPPGSKRFKVHESGFGENVMSPHEDQDRVDLWLLHQLRISPMNVNLLVSIAEAKFKQIDEDTWQLDVLAFWYNDGPKRKVPIYSYASSGVVTQAPRNSLKLDSSVSDDTEPDIDLPAFIPAGQIGGSEAGSVETQRLQGILTPFSLRKWVSRSL